MYKKRDYTNPDTAWAPSKAYYSRLILECPVRIRRPLWDFKGLPPGLNSYAMGSYVSTSVFDTEKSFFLKHQLLDIGIIKTRVTLGK